MNDANQRLSRKLLAEIRLLVIHNKPAIPAMLNKRQVVTIYHACPNDQNVGERCHQALPSLERQVSALHYRKLPFRSRKHFSHFRDRQKGRKWTLQNLAPS